MNLPTFLKELSSFKGRFHLEWGRVLRHVSMKTKRGDLCCPLAAVYRKVTGKRMGSNYQVCEMADGLGLRRPTARSIAEAADGQHSLWRMSEADQTLRRKLLKALGMEERV